MSDSKSFDLESVYDEQIAALMTQIIAVCKEHHLPMFATFLYGSDEQDGETYCTTNLLFDDRHMPDNFKALEPSIRPRQSPSFRIRTKNTAGDVVQDAVFLD